MNILEKAYIPYFDKAVASPKGYEFTPHKARHFSPTEHKRELFELRLSLGQVSNQAAINTIVAETGWSASVVEEYMPAISKNQWEKYSERV